ncbi:MAG: lysophospholipid acyltransferase family protein [Mycobacteriales bacterium]
MRPLTALRDRLERAQPGDRLRIDGGPRVSPAQRLVELLLPWLVRAIVVRDYRGQHHVPARGPVIVASNHISDADPFVLSDFLLGCGRHAHLLAKRVLFTVPGVGWFLRKALMIPVRRGSAVAANALIDATAALRAGAAVGIYPEGEESLDPTYWPMTGQPGVAALARETGAPVIPVVVWGTQHIRGRTRSLHLLPRSHVSVWAGDPVDLSAWRDAPFTDQVLKDMTDHVMAAVLELEERARRQAPPAPVLGPRPGWRPDRAQARQGVVPASDSEG